jgi:hypothetical protein
MIMMIIIIIYRLMSGDGNGLLSILARRIYQQTKTVPMDEIDFGSQLSCSLTIPFEDFVGDMSRVLRTYSHNCYLFSVDMPLHLFNNRNRPAYNSLMNNNNNDELDDHNVVMLRREWNIPQVL